MLFHFLRLVARLSASLPGYAMSAVSRVPMQEGLLRRPSRAPEAPVAARVVRLAVLSAALAAAVLCATPDLLCHGSTWSAVEGAGSDLFCRIL